MRKLYLFALALATLGLIGPAASAQTDCTTGRYVTEVFGNFDLTSDVTYGSNVNYQGNNQSLEMDIYEPQGDTEPLRPLIVWAHGGSFVGGDKTQGDVTAMTQPFAKMGYVTASMEYRLGMDGIPFPGPDSSDAVAAVFRAVHDAKAAVRWFWKDARENGNTYRIDTNRIYMGGVSAGAFIALHYAYLDDYSELPAFLDTTGVGLGGGLEGNSGNPGYPSTIQGVINVAGALGDSAWMNAGDLPLVSLHGDQDDVVPYGSQMLTMLGFFPIMEVDGSSSVSARANEVGVDNCFFTYWGQAHVPHVGNQAYTDTTVNFIANWLVGKVCSGSQSTCSPISVSAEEPIVTAQQVSVFPNPSNGSFQLRIEGFDAIEVSVSLFNTLGQQVHAARYTGGELRIDRPDLPAGIYLLRIGEGQGAVTQRILID